MAYALTADFWLCGAAAVLAGCLFSVIAEKRREVLLTAAAFAGAGWAPGLLIVTAMFPAGAVGVFDVGILVGVTLILIVWAPGMMYFLGAAIAAWRATQPGSWRRALVELVIAVCVVALVVVQAALLARL
jgi:hypothetical protein